MTIFAQKNKTMHRNEAAIIINHVALAKQGDNGIGSVCPYVRLFAFALRLEPFDLLIDF